MDQRGGNVCQNKPSPRTVSLANLARDLANPLEFLAGVPCRTPFFEFPDRPVLEIGQSRPDFDHAHHGIKQPFDFPGFEIVEGQTAKGGIVRDFGTMIEDILFENRDLPPDWFKHPFLRDPSPQDIRKGFIDFDGIKRVARNHSLGDPFGEGTGPWTDFEQTQRLARPGNKALGHFSGQGRTAGQNRPGRVEIAPELPEKDPAFLRKDHGPLPQGGYDPARDLIPANKPSHARWKADPAIAATEPTIEGKPVWRFPAGGSKPRSHPGQIAP